MTALNETLARFHTDCESYFYHANKYDEYAEDAAWIEPGEEIFFEVVKRVGSSLELVKDKLARGGREKIFTFL